MSERLTVVDEEPTGVLRGEQDLNERGDDGSIGFHFCEIVASEDVGGRRVEVEDAEGGLDELLEDDGLDDLAGADFVPGRHLRGLVETILLNPWKLEIVECREEYRDEPVGQQRDDDRQRGVGEAWKDVFSVEVVEWELELLWHDGLGELVVEGVVEQC